MQLLTFAQIARLCRTRRRWLHSLVDYAIVSKRLRDRDPSNQRVPGWPPCGRSSLAMKQ